MITAGYNFQLKAASAPPQSARRLVAASKATTVIIYPRLAACGCWPAASSSTWRSGRSCGRRASPRCILVERVRARHRPQRVAGRAALQAHRAAGLLASAARGHSSLRHRQSRHGSGRGRHAAKPAAREPRRPDTARPARRSYGSEQALAWRGRASHSVDALRLEDGTGAPGSPAPRAAVSFSSRGWRRNGKTM